MPGPLPHFTPGEPIIPAVNADYLNGINQRLAGLRPQGRQFEKQQKADVSRIVCDVVNRTSATFPAGSILAKSSPALGFPIATTTNMLEFRDNPLYNVGVPVLATDFPYILLDHLSPNGGIGRAVTCGHTACKVNVTNASHEYANPTPGDHTRLTSAETGQIRITGKPSGTGDLNCAVHLEPSGGGGSGDFSEQSNHMLFFRGASIPATGNYVHSGVTLQAGTGATGVFYWKALIYNSPVFARILLKGFNWNLPNQHFSSSSDMGEISHIIPGSVETSASGMFSFEVTNDGTNFSTVAFLPDIEPPNGFGGGWCYLTNWAYHAHIFDL